jgi:putative acetyltransferase
LVGHVAFSPVTFDSDTECLGYILAPLAIRPSHQKRRIGSRLVESGMQQLSSMGVKIVFVYGDPKYYSRFGFSEDVARRYVPPYQLEYPFGWQGIVLNDYSTEESSVRIACVPSLRDPSLW